jgi:hypothetical protein
MNRSLASTLTLAAALATGCGGNDGGSGSGNAAEDASNPFLTAANPGGKADTAYVNPDGMEVEVDLEADVEAPSYQITRAPAELGQFAVTYLRNRHEFYVESLAEHVGSRDRVEWLVDGAWKTAAEARDLDASKLTHFRIRGVNAVLLHDAADGVTEGTVFKARVPRKPYSVLSDAGEKCADVDEHIGLSQSVYWYQWNPDKSECNVPVQDMSVTVSRMLPRAQATYPEYDKLVADKKVTAVVLFGEIDDGPITENETGMRAFKRMGTWLEQAGFKAAGDAPLGKRYTKKIKDLDVEVDLYSPREFSGLGDFGHFANFQKALSEHEIVVYDGHSMLGASDFWSKPQYPSFYQIYLYGGCLGYEYYVRPIVEGKGGFENVDMMSSVVEVSANALDFAGPALAKIFWALDNGYKASWRDILVAVRERVGDSTFGASGVRDNCFTPNGSRCNATPDEPAADETRYDSAQVVQIPDNKRTGAKSVIKVPDHFTVQRVSVDLKVEHTWVGDLRIVLAHGGKEAVIWDHEGDSQDVIDASFDLGGFGGLDASGDWTLRLADTAAQDTGHLVSWSLVLGR